MSDIKIIGGDELKKFIKSLEIESERELGILLADMAMDTQSKAVESINKGGRTGKLYKRRSVSHRASAGGEFPKTDTGTLTRNITLKKEGKYGWTVGSRKGAPHGFWLEFGTRFMAKRPWLKPSFDATLKKFKGRFR